ncbi:putative uridylate kinase [Iris pallida]|uniref:UMP kinase n=1 Tax=Iris pallida TaxID=29817 RepID=A0AAX6H439_IRIPA|nr:putative uridylate kinase [Iris pallida]
MAATSASSFFTPLFLSTNTHSSPLLSLSRLKAPPPPPPPPPPPLMSFHAQHISSLFVPRCSSSSSSSSQNGSLPESLNSRTKTMIMTSFDAITGEGSIPKPSYRWKRVLLKVSGEALAGDNTQNIDPKVTMSIAREVASVTQLGIQVAIVVGGGNIFRGASWAGSSGLDRSSADYIGMLATVMNAIFLQATMESIGIPTRVQTAFRMSEVAEPYIRRRAVRHLEKGRVVIFAAGSGNPFFTTDTAAALRCAEISAEVVLKATNVDGVYDEDPKLNPKAHLLDTLSYEDVMAKDLSVMDMTAITLCQENNIPVVVFNLNKPGNIAKAIVGERVGTLIGGPRSQLHRPEGNITDMN